MSRVIFLKPKIGLGGPKLLQLQNLGAVFLVFFLRNQNRNFVKVKRRKLLLSLFYVYSNNGILIDVCRVTCLFYIVLIKLEAIKLLLQS